MTPAEQNRAVAEIAGYEVVESTVLSLSKCYIRRAQGDALLFDPLHNPAQAIEALARVFVQVDISRDRDMVTIKGWLSHKDGVAGYVRGQCEDSDPVKAFCAAAVAAILAAGGKK